MTVARLLVVLTTTAAGLVATAAPALADHPHHLMTPNGRCHLVAGGQTAIADPTHGGHHRYHHNVHKGAAADGTLGTSAVQVHKGPC